MEGLIFGILRYASAPWDQFLKKDISALERVQRKAARFCSQNASVTDIHFALFGLKSAMVFEGTTECMNVFIV